MLNEKFVEALQATAVKAAGAVALPIPSDPRNYFLIVNGQASKYDLPPAPRSHSVSTISDIATAAKKWSAETCFHDAGEIILVLKDDDRHDRVTMSLRYDPRFKVLMALARESTQITQRDLLRLLRVTLKGCADETTIASIRGINFDQKAQGESYIAPGTEKIGKSIVANAISQSGSLPEELRLTVPVYTNQGLTQSFSVIVALDIDVTSQKFTVQTAPGEIELITNAITEQIHKQLVDAMPSTTVLRGSP